MTGSGGRQGGIAGRLSWLGLFAAAFGFVEAAVVVYLRHIYYPDGFRFPLHVLSPTDPITVTEVAREACTLLMLVGAAALATRGAWGRFGAFAFAFGVWDLVFYAGLKAVLGWPESPATWDVLFLIPGVWTGPVWSAAAIAALLVVCGALIVAQQEAGRAPRLSLFHWLGALVSLGLLLTSFLWNHTLALEGGVPERFPWMIWLAGVLVGLANFLHVSRTRPS